MIFELKIKTTEEDMKICIGTAWEKEGGKKLTPETIKPFKIGDAVIQQDIKNMTMGSCLATLLAKSEFEMKRVG